MTYLWAWVSQCQPVTEYLQFTDGQAVMYPTPDSTVSRLWSPWHWEADINKALWQP